MIKKKWLFIALLFLVITACECSADDPTYQVNTPGPNQTWIDAPLPNSTIPLQPYKIMFHGASEVEITEFEIKVNGSLFTSVPPTSADENGTLFSGESMWTPPAPGTYLIEVQAIGNDQASSPAQVQVTVLGEEEDDTATPTPTEEIEEVQGCTYTSLVNLNCRLGPGSEYISIGFFLPGQSAPVVGKTGDDIYWYVVAPDTGNVCTVPNNSDYGYVEGDCGILPEFTPVLTETPIPTPTPESACTVEQATGGMLCISPCPTGAFPGDVCVP